MAPRDGKSSVKSLRQLIRCNAYDLPEGQSFVRREPMSRKPCEYRSGSIQDGPLAVRVSPNTISVNGITLFNRPISRSG
jgi:hypothetical protein